MTPNTLFTIKGIRIVTIFYLIAIVMGIIYSLTQYVFHFIPVSVIPLIVTYVSAIIVLYGIHLILKGKKEFGPSHEKSVMMAGKLIIFGILVLIFGMMFLVPFFPRTTIVRAVVGTIIYIPIWLAIVYLIKELAEKIIQNLLWLAFSSNIVISVIRSWIIDAEIAEIPSDLYFLTLSISLVPTLMMIFCYYKTYIRIKNKEMLPNTIK